MEVPCDDMVTILPTEKPGEARLITISCLDKTGLGCDLCRIILLSGLSIVRGDFSTDGKWCYILFWVTDKGRKKETMWDLLKRRLVAACPSALYPVGMDYCYSDRDQEEKPQLFLLKFSCHDRMGLLHDVTEILYELEHTIWRVKVSTTPDGRVMDLFLITDTRELLHTEKRQEDACTRLRTVLKDSMCSCSIEPASKEVATFFQSSTSLPFPLTEGIFNLEFQGQSLSYPQWSNTLSVSMDNTLSDALSLIHVQCRNHKGILYDIMRTLKDYNIQMCYGRFNAAINGNCSIDLFVQNDKKKIADANKQTDICSRLTMVLSSPLFVDLVSRGPDTELIVVNSVEFSGRGRPLVLYDITLALKILKIRIFQAEISRHVVGDRECEVYRVHLGDEHDHRAPKDKIIELVRRLLMGWN